MGPWGCRAGTWGWHWAGRVSSSRWVVRCRTPPATSNSVRSIWPPSRGEEPGDSATPPQSTGSVYQSQGHDQAHVGRGVIPSCRLYRGRPLGRLEGESHFLGGHVLQDFEQVIGIEPHFQRVALVGDGDLVLRLAQVGGAHREAQHSRAEGQPDPVSLVTRDHTDATKRRGERLLVD